MTRTRDDKRLQQLIEGVINRQAKCILLDPYANVFNYGPTGSPWDKDLTVMKPGIHERKWELDSLCYPVRLAYGYWKTTGNTSYFDAKWQEAMKLVLTTFKIPSNYFAVLSLRRISEMFGELIIKIHHGCRLYWRKRSFSCAERQFIGLSCSRARRRLAGLVCI